MNQFIEQLRETMGKLSNGQKASIAVLFVVIVASLVGLMMWASSETQVEVVSSNSRSDIKEAHEELVAAGIPHTISDDGLSIMASKLDVGRAKIISASSGAVFGMEDLKTEMGASPEQERRRYNHAQQGELTRTINALREVESSRVHIVQSDDSPFLNRKNETSASITVRLKPGKRLSPAKVKGITHLVAGAVKGLDADSVVLVNDKGELLSGPSGDDGDISASSKISEQQNLKEQQFQKKIIDHIRKITGSATDVVASVTLDLNREASETEKNAFDPNTQVTISEKINESSSKEDTPVGIPGAESNLPEQAPANEEGASQEKFSSATNYGYTQEKKRTINKPGEIKRISVSVSVDLNKLDTLASESNGAMDIEAYKTQIQKSVKAAVGFNEERGDQAEILFYAFNPMSSDDGFSEETGSFAAIMPYLVIIGVLLLLFFFIVRPLVSSLTTAVKAGAPPAAKLEDMTPTELAAYRATYGDSGGPIDRKLEQMIGNFKAIDAKELNQLVQDNEQPSAEVLRRWLRAY